ncbi:hypothetical protein [Anaerotignum sp.]|uniref:OB-fold protein n=1 Tax=Anaerotignum sp. TaxID=2039241 RepID=UPI003735842D
METPKTKKCKFCQSDIPQKASVCPQCGRKQGGKVKWVVLVIVVLVIFGALAGGDDEPASSSGKNPPVAENNTATEPSQTEAEETTPVEIMEISPAELLASYEANEVKGDSLYEGKTMRLSGTVGSIGKDIVEEVYITFAGEDFAITSVQCYFSDEAQIEKVMELQEGDAITLVGVCDGKFGNVLIKDCVFE